LRRTQSGEGLEPKYRNVWANKETRGTDPTIQEQMKGLPLEGTKSILKW
jgi:hypothetical protein